MDFVNVFDNKGVFADGVHDDTKALQACIDGVKNGGTVYFPDGVYLISAALIFYSNQCLRLSDNARILRSDKSEPYTRYLLASYSEKAWSGYSGTHDVVISGGIFDGNENLTEPSTLINTVHCKNIVVENCRFVNCSKWHCIELNSTENATVRGCTFNGRAYTLKCDELHNELIQLDWPHINSYGPVYNCNGELIDFCIDDTACKNVLIDSNIFKCDGFPAIGHHDVDCNHKGVIISNNIFDGSASTDGKSRGYIIFMPKVNGLRVVHNAFCSPEKAGAVNPVIIFRNTEKNALACKNNSYIGYFSDEIINEE